MHINSEESSASPRMSEARLTRRVLDSSKWCWLGATIMVSLTMSSECASSSSAFAQMTFLAAFSASDVGLTQMAATHHGRNDARPARHAGRAEMSARRVRRRRFENRQLSERFSQRYRCHFRRGICANLCQTPNTSFTRMLRCCSI